MRPNPEAPQYIAPNPENTGLGRDAILWLAAEQGLLEGKRLAILMEHGLRMVAEMDMYLDARPEELPQLQAAHNVQLDILVRSQGVLAGLIAEATSAEQLYQKLFEYISDYILGTRHPAVTQESEWLRALKAIEILNVVVMILDHQTAFVKIHGKLPPLTGLAQTLASIRTSTRTTHAFNSSNFFSTR